MANVLTRAEARINSAIQKHSAANAAGGGTAQLELVSAPTASDVMRSMDEEIVDDRGAEEKDAEEAINITVQAVQDAVPAARTMKRMMSSAVQDSQSQVSLQLARSLNAVRGAAMAAKHVSFDKYDEAAVHDFGLMGRCMMSTGRLVKGACACACA